MATNVTVRDLDTYPDNNKTVTVDQTTVVPSDAEGDEKWVLSFTTTAYSNNTNRTAIQDIYVQEFKAGWAKSSGFASSPFTIQSGRRWLGIKIDGSSQYYIQLTDGTYGGDSLAEHIETKIRSLPTATGTWSSSDDSLAYKNAMVDYTDGKFYIISGNLGEHYTGSNRTSVAVSASGSDTLYSYLGFNLGFSTGSISNTAINEALVNQDYTAGARFLYTGLSSGDVSANDSLMITDGSNTDYFTVLAVSGSKLTVPTSGINGFDGISNSYTASEAKVQILRSQDPDRAPKTYHNTIDSIFRWGIMSIANSIDFSS